MTQGSERTSIGAICLSVGLFIGLVAFGVLPVPEENIHAPRWVIGLIAAMFFGFGLAVLLPPGSSLARWFGGAIVVSMTVVSGWVALFGGSEHFSGDWPFLSRDTNVLIARIVFGCVSLLGLAMIAGAATSSWRK